MEITEQFYLIYFANDYSLIPPVLLNTEAQNLRVLKLVGPLTTLSDSLGLQEGEVVLHMFKTKHFLLKCSSFIFQLFYVL